MNRYVEVTMEAVKGSMLWHHDYGLLHKSHHCCVEGIKAGTQVTNVSASSQSPCNSVPFNSNFTIIYSMPISPIRNAQTRLYIQHFSLEFFSRPWWELACQAT